MKTKLVRPVLVESKEIKPNLLLLKNDNTLVHFDEMFYNIWKAHKEFGDFTPTNATYQQLILISLEDEKIEIGDKYIVELFNVEGKSTGFHLELCNVINDVWVNNTAVDLTRHINNCKKVIATQSQLSPEYIQQFIEEYNKGDVKDVEIETIGKIGESKIDYVPITDNGYVTIVNTMKTEEKLQQAANSHADNYYDKNDSEQFTHWCNRQSNFIAGAKSPESLEYWKEKEKLYTEDEVKEYVFMAYNLRTTDGCVRSTNSFIDWFNQHKK